MNFSPTDCSLIMGRRGCGKSFLCKNLQGMFPRVVVIDSLNEYTEADGEVVHDFQSFTDRLLVLQQSKAPTFKIIFQFDPESHVSQSEFDHICRVVFYFGNVLLVIEEVQRYSNPHFMPHWLEQCLLIGRHHGLALMFTSQRPGMVNKTIISQCAHIFCGNIIEGNDLTYISKILRQDTERLITLQDRKFIYFTKDGVIEVSNDF